MLKLLLLPLISINKKFNNNDNTNKNFIYITINK